jgi:hypothetical protein
VQSTDWSSIRSEQAHSGVCECCGLPHWSRGTVCKLPRQRGWFCSIRCLESIVFGPGRCRWCGNELDGKSDRRFCDDACRRRSGETPFGNGTRLLAFICVHHPGLYRELTGNCCAQCGDPLAGKRRGARFCSDRCRVATNRLRLEETAKSDLSVARLNHSNALRPLIGSGNQSIKEPR